MARARADVEGKKYKAPAAREIEDENDPKSYLYWLKEDNLLLLTGWARRGLSDGDIVQLMGITKSVYDRWYSKYEAIRAALDTGKEIVDFKVENALLKAALGYQTKEVRILTVMRHGKMVEQQKEVTEKEVHPQIGAIRMWLLNRQSDWWKNENKLSVDDLLEDSKIHIDVTRATESNMETTSESKKEAKRIAIRRSTEEEQKAYIKEKKEEKKKQKKAATEAPITVISHSEDLSSLDPDDPDYWPEE